METESAGDSRRGRQDRTVTAAADRVMLWCLLGAAIIAGSLATVSGMARAWSLLWGNDATVTVPANAPMTIHPTAGAVSGRFTEASVPVHDLGDAVVRWLVVEVTVVVVAGLVAAVAVGWMAHRLLARGRVHETVYRGILLAGVATAVGGLAGQAAGGWAALEATRALSGAVPGITETLRVSLVPFLAGLAITFAAFLFSLGQRFEDDTEGLV